MFGQVWTLDLKDFFWLGWPRLKGPKRPRLCMILVMMGGGKSSCTPFLEIEKDENRLVHYFRLLLFFKGRQPKIIGSSRVFGWGCSHPMLHLPPLGGGRIILKYRGNCMNESTPLTLTILRFLNINSSDYNCPFENRKLLHLSLFKCTPLGLLFQWCLRTVT